MNCVTRNEKNQIYHTATAAAVAIISCVLFDGKRDQTSSVYFRVFRLIFSEQAGNWAQIIACRAFTTNNIQVVRTIVFHVSFDFIFLCAAAFNEIDCSNEIGPKFFLSHIRGCTFDLLVYVYSVGGRGRRSLNYGVKSTKSQIFILAFASAAMRLVYWSKVRRGRQN